MDDPQLCGVIGGCYTANVVGGTPTGPRTSSQVVHLRQERRSSEVYQAGRLRHRPGNRQRHVVSLLYTYCRETLWSHFADYWLTQTVAGSLSVEWTCVGAVSELLSSHAKSKYSVPRRHYKLFAGEWRKPKRNCQSAIDANTRRKNVNYGEFQSCYRDAASQAKINVFCIL